MPNKKHHIKLDSEERDLLGKIAGKRKAAAVRVQRAKAMLAMDCSAGAPTMTDQEVSVLTGLSVSSLARLRKRVCEIGPLGALERKPRETPPVEPKITGDIQAHIAKIACSNPPEGRPEWTLQLIADRVVELNLLESISRESVRQCLKKTTSNPGNKNAGVSHRKKTLPS
jgi:hypothetical protein